jgi:hypothetical protein
VCLMWRGVACRTGAGGVRRRPPQHGGAKVESAGVGAQAPAYLTRNSVEGEFLSYLRDRSFADFTQCGICSLRHPSSRAPQFTDFTRCDIRSLRHPQRNRSGRLNKHAGTMRCVWRGEAWRGACRSGAWGVHRRPPQHEGAKVTVGAQVPAYLTHNSAGGKLPSDSRDRWFADFPQCGIRSLRHPCCRRV